MSLVIVSLANVHLPGLPSWTGTRTDNDDSNTPFRVSGMPPGTGSYERCPPATWSTEYDTRRPRPDWHRPGWTVGIGVRPRPTDCADGCTTSDHIVATLNAFRVCVDRSALAGGVVTKSTVDMRTESCPSMPV